MSALGKSYTRAAARRKARYAPRGGMSDRRPTVVIEDRGAVKRILRAMSQSYNSSAHVLTAR